MGISRAGITDGTTSPVHIGAATEYQTGYGGGAFGPRQTAKLSITGPLVAVVASGEHRLQNSWAGQNTLAVQNTASGNDAYSAIRFLETAGDERGALGYGNTTTAVDLWYAGAMYMEGSNVVKDDGTFTFTQPPVPVRFGLSGKPNGSATGAGYGQYGLISIDPDLTTRIKSSSTAWSTAITLVEFDHFARQTRYRDNGATIDLIRVDHNGSGERVILQDNRAGKNVALVKQAAADGYAAIVFRDSTDAEVGYHGHGGSTAAATGLQNSVYVASRSLTSTPKSIQFAQFVSGSTLRKRQEFATDGNINFYELAGVDKILSLKSTGGFTFFLNDGSTTAYDHNGSNTHSFFGNMLLGVPSTQAVADGFISANQIEWYLDEAGNNLKARLKYAAGTLKTATIALT